MVILALDGGNKQMPVGGLQQESLFVSDAFMDEGLADFIGAFPNSKPISALSAPQP